MSCNIIQFHEISVKYNAKEVAGFNFTKFSVKSNANEVTVYVHMYVRRYLFICFRNYFFPFWSHNLFSAYWEKWKVSKIIGLWAGFQSCNLYQFFQLNFGDSNSNCESASSTYLCFNFFESTSSSACIVHTITRSQFIPKRVNVLQCKKWLCNNLLSIFSNLFKLCK